ncbi:MAG: hypothetical protein AAGA54_31475, partial [Myxococcota bacterium]
MIAESSTLAGLVLLFGLSACGTASAPAEPATPAPPRVDAALIRTPPPATPWSIVLPDQAGKAQLECLDAGVRIAASFSGTIEIAGQRVDSGGGSDVLIAEF